MLAYYSIRQNGSGDSLILSVPNEVRGTVREFEELLDDGVDPSAEAYKRARGLGEKFAAIRT